MTITPYMEQYFLQYGQLTLPQTGKIAASQRPAKIEKRKAKIEIQAPLTLISFQQNTSAETDSAMTAYIATAKQMTTTEVESRLKSICNDIRTVTDKGGKYQLGHMGYFAKGRIAGELLFEASNYTHIPGTSAPNMSLPIQKKSKRGLALVAAFVVLLVVIGGVIYIKKLHKPTHNTNTQNTENKTTTTDSVVVTTKVENIKPDSLTPRPAEKKYHIIVGSFNNRYNAEKLNKELEESGYEAQIIDKEAGMYRVILSSHNTEEEAYKKLQLFLAGNNKYQVWILAQ